MFLSLRNVAERAAGGGSSGLRSHPVSDEPVRIEREVRFDFMVEFFLRALPPAPHVLRLLWSENAADRGSQTTPLLGLSGQLFATCLRELVEARLPIVRRRTPFRPNPSAVFQTLKCWIQR